VGSGQSAIEQRSLLLVSLAAAETYLHVQRSQAKPRRLQATHSREIASQPAPLSKEQSTLNQISRPLIDKLDVAQISTEVLEKIAQLFEADIVGV